MSCVENHHTTTTIEETGKIILDGVLMTNPYPYDIGKSLLDTKFNKNIHGSFQSIRKLQLPTEPLLKSALNQHHAYRKNLRLLYQETIKKMQIRMFETETDHPKMRYLLGEDFYEALWDLHDFVGDDKHQEYREGYLTEIFRYWRTVADKSEIRRFEDLWVFTAGRPHRQE